MKTIRHGFSDSSRLLKPASYWLHITYLDDYAPTIQRLHNITLPIAKLKAEHACNSVAIDVVMLLHGKCKDPNFAKEREILHRVEPRPFTEFGKLSQDSTLDKLRVRYGHLKRESIWTEKA